MEVINHQKGRNIGRISVLKTVDTMEVSERWETHCDEIDLLDARCLCSRYGRKTGKRFSITAPIEAEGKIIITRLA